MAIPNPVSGHKNYVKYDLITLRCILLNGKELVPTGYLLIVKLEVEIKILLISSAINFYIS